jgi:hypothetical protein
MVGAGFAAADQPKAKPTKADKPAASPPPAVAEPENNAVAAILETKPTTPAECAQAARTLADLGRPDLAKTLLKKILDAQLDPRQLVELHDQVGSPLLFDLANSNALLPESKQLADAVAAAVAAKLQDAKRIEALVRQLQDPSADKRFEALVGLREAREAAVGPLLAALTDPARQSEYAGLRAALVEIGPPAQRPLVAVVEGADPHLAAQAIMVLGAAKDTRFSSCLLVPCLAEHSDPAVREAAAAALRQLTGSVPDRATAVRILTDGANRHFEHPNFDRFLAGADAQVDLWRWDAAKRQCVMRKVAPAYSVRALAAAWARDAHLLAPDDPALRALYLAAALDVAAYETGLDRPLDENHPSVAEAKRLGVPAIEAALTYAMQRGHPAAAAAAARLLGQLGTPSQLLYRGAGPAPLAAAVQSPDRRLRMAAIEAIVRLQPTQPFAGSGYLLPALGYFATGGSSRRAAVACANISESRELAGTLAEAGFVAEAFTTGKDVPSAIARSADYELALVDVTIAQPTIDFLVQQLRNDPRTASLRVGLVARPDYFDRADRLERLDRRTTAIPWPSDGKTFRRQLERLTALAPDEFVDLEGRLRQAARALDLLAALDRMPGHLYRLRDVQDSLIVALYHPKLAAQAAALLAGVNSAESQQALVETASRLTLPLAMRQAAVKAFRQNTQQHGILLTTDEIRRQYQRYNDSKKLDPATQHVLGLILDCLEVNVPKKKRG